jgi:PTH1 family peptidyl-tRNA hydrolase
MILLVGLGNPGSQYEGTRHNIGFMALDHICTSYAFESFRPRKQGLYAEGSIAGIRAAAFKPTTYMNLSGSAVESVLRNTPISPEQVYVFHDDLDLKLGQIRVKQGGGAGGHNGIRSLDQHIGNNYWRIRMGIGHPGEKELVHGYVLGKFLPLERAGLEELIADVARFLPLFLKEGASVFQNALTREQQSRDKLALDSSTNLE